MNISKCVLKLFFIAIACVCIQQPMYAIEDSADILTTEIMMKTRPTTINFQKKLLSIMHRSNMKKYGEKDCDRKQILRVHSILEELGVEKPQQVPVKQLKKEARFKYSALALAKSTGIWISPSDNLDIKTKLIEAHETYHYANKHAQQSYLLVGLILTHVLSPFIPSYSRYFSKIITSSKSPLLCCVAVLVGYAGIIPISHTLLHRLHERSACSFSIDWVCNRGYDKDVKKVLIYQKFYYSVFPKLKIQLRSINPSTFEYHRYNMQAYKNWKKNQ